MYLHFKWNYSFFHSVVFWFGDLNFRIDDLDMQVVKSAIDNNKYLVLLEKDQVKDKGCFMYCVKIEDCEIELLCMWSSWQAPLYS